MLPQIEAIRNHVEGDSLSFATWTDGLKAVALALFKEVPDALRACLADPDCLWLDRQAKNLARPFQIAFYLWIDLDLSEREALERTVGLVVKCHIPLENLHFICEEKGTAVPDPVPGKGNRGELNDRFERLVDSWNVESKGKICPFMKLALRYLLENRLFSEEKMRALSTVEGTKERIGFSLGACPLFSRSTMVSFGKTRSWKEPVVVDGVAIFVNHEWYEKQRSRCVAWLREILARGQRAGRLLHVSWGVEAFRCLVSTPISGLIGLEGCLPMSYLI